MREPPPTSYETMLATCKDPGALRPAAERAATAMAVTTADDNTTDVTVSLPTVEFNLADSASHDEQGYHVWRFDDSRRWERRRYGEAARAIVARRFPEQGHKHVSINREFSNDELPHRIAFLISVYDELDEPPFSIRAAATRRTQRLLERRSGRATRAARPERADPLCEHRAVLAHPIPGDPDVARQREPDHDQTAGPDPQTVTVPVPSFGPRRPRDPRRHRRVGIGCPCAWIRLIAFRGAVCAEVPGRVSRRRRAAETRPLSRRTARWGERRAATWLTV